MKINELLMNTLKITSPYKDAGKQNKSEGQVVNGRVEYWDKSDKASEILNRYNVPKTEENAKGIEAFMKNSEGGMEAKLETIEVAASSGVEMTENNLNSVHEALHEDFALKESIEVLVVSKGESESDLTVSDIKEMELPADLKEEILSKIEEGMPPLKAVAEALGKSLGEKFLSNYSQLTNGEAKVTIRITIEIIEITYKKEGSDFDLEKLMAKMDALVESVKNGQSVLITSVNELIKALDNLDLESKEDAPQVIESTLETEKDVEKIDNLDGQVFPLEDELDTQIAEWISGALTSVEAVSSDFIDSFEQSNTIKLYVETSVTVKMQDVVASYKTYKNDLLNKMDQVLDTSKPLSSTEIKEVISGVINKLDDLLLKSEIPLYTSMTMEKQLLKMSSDLQLARQSLVKGNVVEAKTVVKNVYKALENAVFDPSERKIKAFAIKESQQFFQEKDLLEMQSFKQQGTSARNVLELFRSLGLNHEYEVSEKLSQLKTLEKELKLDTNLKSVLHKLDQDEKSEEKTVETIEKSLNNLNGQQLLNRQGQKNSQQTMFFNIPLVANEEIKNMKLYVNSRDANNQLDWENCSLYFVIDLKSYGPTGIKVDIKDRGVTITVKNDDETLKDIIEPLIKELGTTFEEVGFKEKDVFFVPLDQHKKFGRDLLKEKNLSEVKRTIESKPQMDKKGFDFKI